jgi:hypothetical protein
MGIISGSDEHLGIRVVMDGSDAHLAALGRKAVMDGSEAYMTAVRQQSSDGSGAVGKGGIYDSS